MGASKTYKGGPGWAARNTPGANTTPSKGAVVNAEGTHMSGEGYNRNVKAGTRDKSSSGKKSAKAMGIYGQS